MISDKFNSETFKLSYKSFSVTSVVLNCLFQQVSRKLRVVQEETVGAIAKKVRITLISRRTFASLTFGEASVCLYPAVCL